MMYWQSLQDPAWITAISTILAVITSLAIALFRDNYIAWKNRPIIRLGLKNKEPHVLTLYSASEATITYLFRIKVINDGKTIAKNCKVKILSVSPAPEERYFEPDILKWSSAPREMQHRIDIPHIERVDISQLIPIHKENKDISPYSGSEFCDLFSITSRGNMISFISSGKREFLAREKDYMVTIEICGDNLEPKRASFRISLLPDFPLAKVDWVYNPSNSD
ncbi:MAG: hypothetical protein AABW79_02335 [Nanoarchaeota archaeon]